MPTAYVTGANGFIASHLIPHLLERGTRVVGLVRRTSDVSSLAPLFPRYGDRLRLVVGDLRDRPSLGPGLEGVDYVYHLGAVLMGTAEEEFRATNVEGTRNLLEAVRERCPRLQRFLYTSSLAAAGPSPDGRPVDERAEPRPVSWYGRSKRDAEAIVRAAGAGGLPVTIVRPVAVYGEREQDLSRGTFPAVKLGLAPRIGFGRKYLSMIYVEDLVEGMIAAAESSGSVGGTYFLSDPHPYETAELVGAMADAMGKRVRIPLATPALALQAAAVGAEWVHEFTRGRPLLTRDKVREVTQRAWVCTPAAAEQDFGWRARTPLEDGIAREVRYWDESQRRTWQEPDLPARERAIQTYSLAVAFGIFVEGLARLGDWYTFHPRWLIAVIVLGVFGAIMGTITFVLARRSLLLQFLAGAVVGIGAELANAFWLNAWTFNPASLGRIPGPWLRALVLGLPAGVLPIVVNTIVRSLYLRRERIG